MLDGVKDSSDGFDGSLDKDKQSSSPLIIDGMEVDREVKNNDRSITKQIVSFFLPSIISRHL